jgi:hypothetical protein
VSGTAIFFGDFVLRYLLHCYLERYARLEAEPRHANQAGYSAASLIFPSEHRAQIKINRRA